LNDYIKIIGNIIITEKSNNNGSGITTNCLPILMIIIYNNMVIVTKIKNFFLNIKKIIANNRQVSWNIKLKNIARDIYTVLFIQFLIADRTLGFHCDGISL